MKSVILQSDLAPGDDVMLTAAVRDLHICSPRRFLTDVRTPFPELWSNNPHLTPLDSRDPGVETIPCHYPLVHHCNQRPYHFLHGYEHYLAERLGARIEPMYFKGDIHLSAEEKAAPRPFCGEIPDGKPLWIVVAGGKVDFTIKWWSPERFQAVVDAFRETIAFVQVGADGHHHPPLRDVVDLRGRTSLRDLILLMHHADGVVCPVTLAMHLAAAVPTRPGKPVSRACVVVAGGREPPHWEAYPAHQFLHTVGMLDCCRHGGCWKARTFPLGDNDTKDKSRNLCVNVSGDLPRCMDMIQPEDVIRAVGRYLQGTSNSTAICS